MENNLNKYSATLTQNDSLPAAQAMLYGVGLEDDDFTKPQIGIASTGYDGNPCNMHLNGLADIIKKSTNDEKLVGFIFNTIGVSDGMSMGTDGMAFSLPSRDLIADSIETVVSAQWYDGLVAVAGCDKNMPGALIAMGRLNRPALLLYGGSIHPGYYKDEELNIVSAFEALGKKITGSITPEDFKGIIKNACPGAGACGGMYTANTIASAIEAMGMSLPYSSSNPAESEAKQQECKNAGAAVRKLLEMNILPRDIITFKAFENAITMVMAMGGSTNAVMHLIAMAKSVGVQLTLDDFQRISNKTPYIADLKPSGRYLMEHVYNIGGVPAIMKLLLEKGFLHGDCPTVTGHTVAENLKDVNPLAADQKVIYPIDKPIKPNGHLQILYGNLAEKGAVAKITGKEGDYFQGPARVYNNEKEANEGINNNEIKEGDVVVIRYEGPKGGPGMREMLKPTSLIMGAGLGNKVALITDGRFSGGTHGFVVGHITPEAFTGGNIALINDGDMITIDSKNNKLNVDVSEEELVARKQKWKQPDPRAKQGVLYKYMKTVSSASEGCVTDE